MESKIKEIMKEVLTLNDEELGTISPDSNLVDIGLDSIKAIEVIVRIEEIFGITVNEDDLLINNIDSISKVMELINKYQNR